MDIDDAALMYEGWIDERLFNQQAKTVEIEAIARIVRQATAYITDTISKIYGGKGLFKELIKNWKIGDDIKQPIIDTELEAKLKRHNELGLKNGMNRIKSNNLKMPIEIKDPPLLSPVKKRDRNGKR